MIMIPIGVLVILILRNLGGLQTLGTFTPVLIARRSAKPRSVSASSCSP